MSTTKKLTKNEEKSRIAKEFLDNADKYHYDDFTHICQRLRNGLLHRCEKKFPNILSIESMHALMAFHDDCIRMIDENEHGYDSMTVIHRKAYMTALVCSFLSSMNAGFAGVSRVLRAGEPIGMFIAYIVNNDIKNSVDAVESHVGDIPNMESAMMLVDGLLPRSTYGMMNSWQIEYDCRIKNRRVVTVKTDNMGKVIRNAVSRSYNTRIFVDMVYRDLKAITAKYPNIFSSIPRYAYDERHSFEKNVYWCNSNTPYMKFDGKGNHSSIILDEVNENNSILWSRAIDLDDLLSCMQDVNDGCNEDILHTLESTLEKYDMNFSRIVDILRDDCQPTDDDYNDANESMQIFSDGCAEGVMHFNLDSICMMMYGAIAFGLKEKASIYATLLAFLMKYKDDDETRSMGGTVTLKNGNMNATMLQIIHDMPYEFSKEQFDIYRSNLNNVSRIEND